MSETKRCSKCKRALSLKAFYTRLRKGKKIIVSACKECTRAKVRKYDASNRKRHVQRFRLWRKKNPAKSQEQKRRYQARNKLRTRAHQALHNAVVDGRIVKPATCEGCRKKFNPKKLHGHHPDYRKPLLVIWLCDPCHKREHKRLRNV